MKPADLHLFWKQCRSSNLKKLYAQFGITVILVLDRTEKNKTIIFLCVQTIKYFCRRKNVNLQTKKKSPDDC